MSLVKHTGLGGFDARQTHLFYQTDTSAFNSLSSVSDFGLFGGKLVFFFFCGVGVLPWIFGRGDLLVPGPLAVESRQASPSQDQVKCTRSNAQSNGLGSTPGQPSNFATSASLPFSGTRFFSLHG